MGMKYNEPFKQENWIYAFGSGVICSWPLVVPLLLKVAILFAKISKTSRKFLYFHMVLSLFAAAFDAFTLCTYNPRMSRYYREDYTYTDEIFRNHTHFYIIHAIAELLSVVCVLSCALSGSKAAQ